MSNISARRRVLEDSGWGQEGEVRYRSTSETDHLVDLPCGFESLVEESLSDGKFVTRALMKLHDRQVLTPARKSASSGGGVHVLHPS